MARYFIRYTNRPWHIEIDWEEEAEKLSEFMAGRWGLALISSDDIKNLADTLRIFERKIASMDRKPTPSKEKISEQIQQLQRALHKVEKFVPHNCFSSGDPTQFIRAFVTERLFLTAMAGDIDIPHRDVSISMIDWLCAVPSVIEIIERINAQHEEMEINNAEAGKRHDQEMREVVEGSDLYNEMIEMGFSHDYIMFCKNHERVPNKRGAFGVNFQTLLLGDILPRAFSDCYGSEVNFGSRRNIDGERIFEGAGYDFIHYCMVEIFGIFPITFDAIDNAIRIIDNGGRIKWVKIQDDTTDNT